MKNPYRSEKVLAESYLGIKKHVIKKGFAWEIDWQQSQSLKTCSESQFYREAAWVILSSGMSVRSVSSVFENISAAFKNWENSEVILNNKDSCVDEALRYFNHKGKINAILSIIQNVKDIGFEVFKYNLLRHGVEYIQQFSFFGPATSYHLAKNIGMDVVKPDRHLIRLAEALNFSNPYKLCEVISNSIDEKMSVIDVVLWRYCVMNPNYLALIDRYKNNRYE